MTTPLTRHDVLAEEKQQAYFINTLSTVAAERQAGQTIYPPQKDVFNAFRYTELSDVKVVIPGRIHTTAPGRLTDWHFPYVRAWPSPSLLNMYKELEGTIRVSPALITVIWKAGRAGRAVAEYRINRPGGSGTLHASLGWETFTDKVISLINEHREGVVFYSGVRMPKRKGRLSIVSVITC